MQEDDEQLENEELDLPTSPSTYDSNTQTQKPFVIYENTCYDECETKNSMVLYVTQAIIMEPINLLFE